MTQSGNLKFHTPIFRVNNRQENIDFYQNTLGFKLLTEENALAVFTDWSERNSLFVIEESPAYRCRAVEGPKKINKVVIKVSNPLEIEYLLARDDHQAKAIFQGEKGYAFETISPENGLILMHAEDDLSTLKTVEYADVEEKEDFKEEIIIQNKDEKAIELAKKEWGEDDTVTFNIEKKNGAKYYIAVKKDAMVVEWYEVDTESWKISEY